MGHFIFIILHLLAILFGFIFLIITVPLHIIYSAVKQPKGTRPDGKRQTSGLFGSVIDDIVISKKMRECPYCMKKIDKKATKCPYCQEWIQDAESKDNYEHDKNIYQSKNGLKIFLIVISLSLVIFLININQKKDITNDVEEKIQNNKHNTVKKTKEIDIRPKAINKVHPTYPFKAQRRGIEGKVTLRFLVDEQGQVIEFDQVQSEPKGMFEESAKKAVKQWKFEPAKRNGKAVASWVQMPIRFELSK